MAAASDRASSKHDADRTELDMAAIRKGRRAKRTKTASSTHSSTSMTSSKSSHCFLAESEVSVIEHWNDSIPTKSTARQEDYDPVIDAYLKAKMALFKKMPAPEVKERKSSSTLSTTKS